MLWSAALASALLASGANAVAIYYQCGGLTYTGSTVCDVGLTCVYFNDYYSQCLPSSTTATATTSKSTTTTSTSTTTSASATASGLKGLNLLARAHGRYFGTANDGIWSNTDTAYQAITGNSSEFGFLTPGNAMKWDTTEPSRNSFSFTHADYTVSWAHNHSQIVRGHNFVWNSQLPSWVSGGGFDNATLISILQNHINTEAGHFAGQVRSWDVINEPFNDDGTWRSDVWYNTIGPAYIAIALGFAHTADPNAKLYINDYNIEWSGSKSNALYNLSVSLLAQGAPLHGIGFEGHLILNSFDRSFQANFQRFGSLGLELAITELDIRFALPATDTLLSQQAENYAYVVNACLAVAQCIGITTWDTSDDYSWIPSVFSGYGDALLFDSNKQPKPAYYSVASALAAATVSGPYRG
ncbi:endo-1,4-B-xylanase A [Clavulina sp. PMI_390]|nr:endo-1,4-B-xylanase A [Clavulina sp. PMI_390]